MDSDKMLEFESAYNSICQRLKTLRTIYMNQKVANPENNISLSRSCNTASGMTTAAEAGDLLHMYPAESPGDPLREKNPVGYSGRLLENAEESIADHQKDPDGNVAANIQIRADGTQEHMGQFTCRYKATTKDQTGVLGEAIPWKKERWVRSRKILRSPRPMEVLKEQARKWVGEQIIEAFEERSGKVGRIGIGLVDSNMTDIVGNISHILQGGVNQIEVKAKIVAELKEALSHGRSLSSATKEKRLALHGLLDKAFSTAENGIFMCSQCQYVAESINEPQVPAKMDPITTNDCVLLKQEMKTSCNVLAIERASTKLLLDKENGRKDNLASPLVEDTHNMARRLWSRIFNEKHKVHHKNIWGMPSSKQVDVNDKRFKLELEGDIPTDSVSSLKRKWMDDNCVKGRSPKALKFIVQKPNMQCSNGRKECYSTTASENYHTKLSDHDSVGVSDLMFDHDKHEDGEHSIGQETNFTLLLDEESDDNLE